MQGEKEVRQRVKERESRYVCTPVWDVWHDGQSNGGQENENERERSSGVVE